MYAFVFWITKKNFEHVFGLFLIGLICCLIYKVENEHRKNQNQTKDLIYLSIGFCFNSLIGGFPLTILK